MFVFCALILAAEVVYETDARVQPKVVGALPTRDERRVTNKFGQKYFCFHYVTAEICQVKPQEKHCLIEYMVRDRWPHQERWAFDWRRQHCYEIRWADHCGAVKEETNNFSTEKECLDQCTGWAK